MMPRKPENPEEQWEALERAVESAEAHAPHTESDEDVDAELRAFGMDPDRVGEEGRAFVERMLAEDERAEEEARGAPRRVTAVAEDGEVFEEPPRRVERGRSRTPARRVGWTMLPMVAAAAVTVVAATAVTIAIRDDRVPEPTPPVPTEGPRKSEDALVAATLRQEAHEACGARAWQRCLVKLDDARNVDPAGDSAPGVAAERERAVAGLRAEQEKGKHEEPKKAPGSGP